VVFSIPFNLDYRYIRIPKKRLGVKKNTVLQPTMKKHWLILTLLLAVISPTFCLAKTKKFPIVEIVTSKGNIYIWLYDDTPKHKDNFLKLAKEGYYDQTKFHRIIKDFMIQGGDPYSKKDSLKEQWGQGGPGYTIEAEIFNNHYHKKGMLAAARMGDQVNPERASSGSQFYIVQGSKFNDQTLDYYEKQIRVAIKDPNYKFTEAQRKEYKEYGGSPLLDMQYTVFGEVIVGLEVVDLIAEVQTGAQDKPVENLEIDINVLELTAKQIKKKYNFKIPGSSKK
jgi:cyclophilin family peptidyl-prolyl cis-trans isomerase